VRSNGGIVGDISCIVVYIGVSNGIVEYLRGGIAITLPADGGTVIADI